MEEQTTTFIKDRRKFCSEDNDSQEDHVGAGMTLSLSLSLCKNLMLSLITRRREE
jgi:hypothetical protein